MCNFARDFYGSHYSVTTRKTRRRSLSLSLSLRHLDFFHYIDLESYCDPSQIRRVCTLHSKRLSRPLCI